MPVPRVMQLTVLTVLGAAFIAGAAAAAELKMAHFMSPRHPMDRGVMTPLAKMVGEESGGSLTIKIYPAGELGKGPSQQYKRAVTGVTDIAFNLPQYTATQFKRTVLLHVPGIFTSPSQATEAVYGQMDALAPDYERVKLLAFWTNNPAILFTRNKPIRTFADIKGMKVRTPDPVSAEILKAWGAIPVSLPVTQAYNALATGIVDAILVGPSAIGSFKLHEVANYITMNAPSALSTFTLIMNKQSWDALSSDHKALIDKHTGKALGLKAANVYEAAGKKGLGLAKKAGIEFITLDDAEVAKFSDAMKPAISAYLKSEGDKSGFDAAALITRLKGMN
jgi:TRAP-type C4-dicarboxylate transport system substrate-binding protein